MENNASDSMQRVDPSDASSFKRFGDHMAWSWTQTVVVASDPNGSLAQVLLHQQSEGVFGSGAPRIPNWLWLSDSDRVDAIRSMQWQQIALQATARGDGWQPFAERFQERWGQTPG